MKKTALLLGLALACGKGTAPAAPVAPPQVPSVGPLASGLDYADPASAGWRLVRDPASTTTRLLLNLVGPAGFMTRGAGFNLIGAPGVKFIYFTETNFPLRDLGVYELHNSQPSGGPDPLEPILLAGAVQKNNKLTVAEFQKDRRVNAKDSGVPLFQIGLQLDPSVQVHAGDELTLTITKSQFMAEDIGAFNPNPTVEMVEKGHLQNMVLAVGSLHAN
jgi:hypothetical protein